MELTDFNKILIIPSATEIKKKVEGNRLTAIINILLWVSLVFSFFISLMLGVIFAAILDYADLWKNKK